MKKIKIILFALVIIFGVSCDDDGGSSVIELKEGAVPDMVKDPATDQIIDLIKVTNGDPVNIGFSAEVAQGEPVTTDIVGHYKTFEGPVYKSVLFNDVTLPMDFTLNVDDIVNAFSELNSTEDILLGDILSITARFTMADGTILNIINDDGTSNTGTNISSTVLFTSVITYPVSCPTMLQGDYTSIVLSSNIGLDGFRSPQPVKIEEKSSGTYILSDGTADIFGPDFPIGLEFTDVCGTITVTEQSVDFPGQVDFVQGPETSLDPETGIIILDLTYSPTSCCGLAGIQYTLQLIPD